MMRNFILFTILACLPGFVFAQKQNPDSTAVANEPSEPDWQFEGLIYQYILPDENNFLLPIFYADYKSFHAEVRYNYEDKNTASVFGGYRFETGNKAVLGATPVVGFVFGNTNGIAPGLVLDLTYGKFDFYSESEYMMDYSSSEDNYFYTWSELAVTPGENVRMGLSANRTRLFQTDLEIQRGIFTQYTFKKLTAGLHYFNLFTEDDFFIAQLGFEF